MNNERSTSYAGGDNFRIAQEMSAKWAERGPDFEAALYAVEQSASEPVPYDERRGI